MDVKVNENILELIANQNLVASNLEEQMNVTKTAIAENPNIEVVELNLEGVEEIDSLGINLVVGLYKQISSSNKKFLVTNTSRSIKNLFNLFKLNAYFEVK